MEMLKEINDEGENFCIIRRGIALISVMMTRAPKTDDDGEKTMRMRSE